MTTLQRVKEQISSNTLQRLLGGNRTTVRRVEKGKSKKHEAKINKHLIAIALGILERLKE